MSTAGEITVPADQIAIAKEFFADNFFNFVVNIFVKGNVAKIAKIINKPYFAKRTFVSKSIKPFEFKPNIPLSTVNIVCVSSNLNNTQPKRTMIKRYKFESPFAFSSALPRNDFSSERNTKK
jgi:hypothetical protein